MEYFTLNFKYLSENLQHKLSLVVAELFSNSLILSIYVFLSKFDEALKLMTNILSAVESDVKDFIDSLDELGLGGFVKTHPSSKNGSLFYQPASKENLPSQSHSVSKLKTQNFNSLRLV